jgi:hypothetical protein
MEAVREVLARYLSNPTWRSRPKMHAVQETKTSGSVTFTQGWTEIRHFLRNFIEGERRGCQDGPGALTARE